ncbi:MAG: hypothetical protein OEZ01_01225 [Candidatus Heimdallarchaeota archaeon]|nr:hypothetical protein [Candidatus Heimdallarchaeota archaeon]MDH5644595.1 hypothetical protein [Candidatus Heimdallarchaeota archaeon]
MSSNMNYKGVGIYKNDFPMARYFFDVKTDNNGLTFIFMWARNTFRIPIVSSVRDILYRKKVSGKSPEDLQKIDERHFYISYDNVIGLVNDTSHKEIQLNSNIGIVSILFRSKSDYTSFMEIMKTNLQSKLFTRDTIEIKPSVYVS